MRIFLAVLLLTIASKNFAADYINVHMLDIMQYERGTTIVDRDEQITKAFKECNVKWLAEHFLSWADIVGYDSKGNPIYSVLDSVSRNRKLDYCCFLDIDGDNQKEILYHERNLAARLQFAVILKLNANGKYEVVFWQSGYFSAISFDNHVLKILTTSELAYDNGPFNTFYLHKVNAGKGKLEIIPNQKLLIPVNYHYPLRAGISDKVVFLKTDSVYFYYRQLYNEMNYPYKVEMKDEFKNDLQFMSRNYDWPVITSKLITWFGYVENRGDFSSVVVCLNTSYATEVPEYLYLYIPNKYLDISVLKP